jgi:hypothetical protein
VEPEAPDVALGAAWLKESELPAAGEGTGDCDLETFGSGSGGTVTDGSGVDGAVTGGGTGNGTVIVGVGSGVAGSGPDDAWLATGGRASEAITPAPVAATSSRTRTGRCHSEWAREPRPIRDSCLPGILAGLLRGYGRAEPEPDQIAEPNAD